MSNRTSNRISIEERIRSLENRLRMMQKLPPMEQGKTHLPGVVLNRNSEADSKGSKSGNQEPSQQQQQQQAAAAANPNGTSGNKNESTSPSAATAAVSRTGGAPPAGGEHGKEEQELEAYLHRVMTGCVSSKDPEKLAAEAENKPSLPPDTQGLRYASVLLADAKKKNNNVMPTSRAAPSSAPAGSGGMNSPNRKKKTRYMLKAKKPRQVEEMDREDEEQEEMSLIPKRKFRVVYRPKGKKGATEEEQEQASQKTFFSRTFTISGSDLNPVDLPMESMYFAKKKCEPKTVRRPKPAPAKKPEKPVYRGCLNPSYSQTMPVPKHHEWCSPTLSGSQAGRRVSQPCEHTSPSPSRSALLAATLPTPVTAAADPLNNSEKRLGTPSMGSTSSSRRGQARSSSGVRLEPISPAEPNFAFTPVNPADSSDKLLGEQQQRLIAVSTTPDSSAPPQETTQTRAGSPSSHARERDTLTTTTTTTERAESRSSPLAGRRRASSPPAPSPLQPSAPAGTSASQSASQGFRRHMHQPSTAAASEHSGRHQGRGALGEMPGNRRGESLNHFAQKILLDLDKAGTAEENARSARLGLKKTYEENPRFASTIHPTGGEGGLSKSSLADLIAKRQDKTEEISSARFASTMPLPNHEREPRVPSPVLSVTVETVSPSGADLRETERRQEEESPASKTKKTLIPNHDMSAEERRRRQVEEELRIARENAQFVQQVAPTPPPPTTEAGARWHAQRAAEEKARLAALLKDEAPVAANKEGPPAPVPEPVNPPEPEPERPAWLDDKLRESDRILLDYESAESKKEYRQLYLDYGHHLDGTEDGLLELWSALGGTAGWERALRPAQLSLLLSQEVTMKVRFRVGDEWLAYLGGTSIPKGEVTGFFSALLSRLPRLEFIELFDCPERPFSWSTVLQAHRAFQALKGAYFLYTGWTSTDVLQLVKLCPRIEKGKIRTDTHMQCILGLSAEQLMDECEGKVLVRSY